MGVGHLWRKTGAGQSLMGEAGPDRKEGQTEAAGGRQPERGGRRKVNREGERLPTCSSLRLLPPEGEAKSVEAGELVPAMHACMQTGGRHRHVGCLTSLICPLSDPHPGLWLLWLAARRP